MSHTRALFSNINYIYYLFVRIFLTLAVTMMSVAVGWHIYEATSDPMALAYVGIAQVAPMWMLFMLTGWVADNFSRRNVLLAAMSVQLCTYGGMAWLMKDGIQDVFPIYVLLFVNCCARAFIGPAIQSILPNIVEKKLISQAVSIASTIWQGAMTAGPFVGGLLLAAIDVDIYWVMMLAVALCLFSISRLPQLKAVKSDARAISDIIEGMKFVWGNPYVFPSMALDLFAMMLGGVMAFLPIYAMDILQVGPDGLGYMRAMPAVGSVIAGLLVSKFGYGGHAGKALFVALIVFALSILGFALSTTFWITLVALAIYGGSDMISVIIRSSILHLATPDELRGRTNAVNSLFIASSNELGDFRAGAFAAWVGAVPAAIIGAFSALAVAGIGYWRSKAMRELKSVDDIN